MDHYAELENWSKTQWSDFLKTFVSSLALDLYLFSNQPFLHHSTFSSIVDLATS
jgi:hypothetical protein